MSDTVCKRCPAGHFSTSDSPTEPCQPHRNCSDLGLKTLRWGTSTSDSLCATQDKTATLQCSQHHTLCHNGKTLYSAVGSKSLLGIVRQVLQRRTSGGQNQGWDCTHAMVFFNKTSIVNNLKSVTNWIITDISFLYAGGFLGRLWSRFHSFPNSCVFENQHKRDNPEQRVEWDACSTTVIMTPWWINYSFNCHIPKLSQTQMKHKTGWFVFVTQALTMTDADN